MIFVMPDGRHANLRRGSPGAGRSPLNRVISSLFCRRSCRAGRGGTCGRRRHQVSARFRHRGRPTCRLLNSSGFAYGRSGRPLPIGLGDCRRALGCYALMINDAAGKHGCHQLFAPSADKQYQFLRDSFRVCHAAEYWMRRKGAAWSGRALAPYIRRNDSHLVRCGADRKRGADQCDSNNPPRVASICSRQFGAELRVRASALPLTRWTGSDLPAGAARFSAHCPE